MKEEKPRIQTRLSPEAERKMELAMHNANCKSRNEFVERAICFYSDYIMSKEVTNFLAPMLVSALRATIQSSEDRISRLLFKQTVELCMMMNVLAGDQRRPVGRSPLAVRAERKKDQRKYHLPGYAERA